ncbi:choline transporter-like protein 1 isoform X2 [Mytilus californianus]|uniref:choline transporter-like protein 1 isoform X2 n=1 Tax=Mytilus californianus TaxID=6549 RepID=UPI0022486BF6|nr:choline transporter-like protein 1 isoform X2 [Mytilus californianus]
MCAGDCCCCDQQDSSEKARLTNPVENRGCTDIPVLLIFVLFWAGMIYIAAFSVSHGDAFRLVYGYDSFGNTCDEDNADKMMENVSLTGLNHKGKPYVFFLDIRKPLETTMLCVTKCPDKELTTIQQVQEFAIKEGSKLCRYDVPIDKITDPANADKCPQNFPVWASKPLMSYCVPGSLAKLIDKGNSIIAYFNSFDLFNKLTSDLARAWREILQLCVLALVFAVIMVLLIRFMASIIVYVILAVAIVASLAATGFLWWTYADIVNDLNDDIMHKIPLLDIEVRAKTAFLVYSIIASILTVILLLIILVMRKRVGLVVALFYEAGDCLSTVPLLLVQPLWTFLLLMAFFFYWVIILAYLSTSEIREYNNVTGHIDYREHETVSYFWWYHLIGLIWTSEFIIACQQLVVSGTVATWYFSRNRNDLSCTICKSMKMMIFYHLGSVAFGAFVITLVKLPRMILMYIHKKLKSSAGSNKCAEYCLKCCICCLCCLEKCLKFLNQNAYTVVAINGTSFCTSARKAFFTIIANALRVAAINSVGDFILFLGKIGVTAATGAVGIVWFKTKSELHFYAVPVLLVCVFAYFVAHCFLSVYEMVIDALLLCFVADVDDNDGTDGRPYYASDKLRSFINSYNKKYIEETSTELNLMTRKDKAEEAEPAQI